MMPILITVSTFIISACMNSEGTLTFQYFNAFRFWRTLTDYFLYTF